MYQREITTNVIRISHQNIEIKIKKSKQNYVQAPVHDKLSKEAAVNTAI